MMTYFGAGGETRHQLQAALHLKETDTKEELIRAFKMENFYQVLESEFMYKILCFMMGRPHLKGTLGFMTLLQLYNVFILGN